MYLFCLLHICLIRFAFCNSVQGMMLNESKWRWKWEILSSPCKSLWSDRLPNWTLSAQKTTILVFRDLFLKLICNWGHGSLKIQGIPWKLSSWASLHKKYSIWKVSFTSASSWIFVEQAKTLLFILCEGTPSISPNYAIDWAFYEYKGKHQISYPSHFMLWCRLSTLDADWQVYRTAERPMQWLMRCD